MKIDNQIQVNQIRLDSNKAPQDRVPISEAKLPELQISNQEQALEMAIEKANKVLEGMQRHFEYEVHKPTNQVVISVVDDKTKEVIREIPPKKLLDIISKLWELAGIVVDQKA